MQDGLRGSTPGISNATPTTNFYVIEMVGKPTTYFLKLRFNMVNRKTTSHEKHIQDSKMNSRPLECVI